MSKQYQKQKEKWFSDGYKKALEDFNKLAEDMLRLNKYINDKEEK